MTLCKSIAAAGLLLTNVSWALGEDVLYHLTRLGSVNPYGLCNNPAVTGSGYGNGSNEEAFLWTPETGMTGLGRGPFDFGSYGYAVSNLAHITGATITPEAPQGVAFLWTIEEGMMVIGALPGEPNAQYGRGINDLDQIVGYGRFASGHQEAFIWDRINGVRPLGDLPGGQFLSTAYDINNRGQVTGLSISDLGDQAFVWTEQGGFEVIPVGPNIDPFKGEAINELGQVAGLAYGPRGVEGFFWDPVQGSIGTGTLGGTSPNVWPEDLNDHGQVVGTALACMSCSTEAFIWDRVNGIRRIQDLLDASASNSAADRARIAYGINNAGQIVVKLSGGAALLTPFVLADMNCDGSVNQFDIQGFVLTLSGDEARYAETYPNCHGDWAADTNQDGSINLFDIQPFVELLGG